MIYERSWHGGNHTVSAGIEYKRAGKPRWPWWLYCVVALICIAGLILILCSGPGKPRAEDGVDAFDSVPTANAEVCKAMQAELRQLVSVAMQFGSSRMQAALNQSGMPGPAIDAAVDVGNAPAATARAWSRWGAQITARVRAVLLAFGCTEG